MRKQDSAECHAPQATYMTLRHDHHFGPGKISMYLARYHDVTISDSGVWRIVKRTDLNRLPASQCYK